MELDAEHLKLLLSEKTYIEGRISSNLDLQQKVLAVGFTATITALGWLSTTRGEFPTHSIVLILLAIVSFNALTILMTVAYGAFALGALHYKTKVLGKAFQRLLLLPAEENFLDPVTATRSTPARLAFTFATGFLSLSEVALSFVIYGYALMTAEWTRGKWLVEGASVEWPLVVGFVVAGLLLGGSTASLGIFYCAIQRAERT
jgi:hypothetical protein